MIQKRRGLEISHSPGRVQIMKALIFFPGILRGGCEEYALIMARYLLQSGSLLGVCFPRTVGTASLFDDFCALGIPCHRWGPSEAINPDDWGSFDAQYTSALDLLTKTKPDAVLLALPAPNSALGFIAAASSLRIPGAAVFQLCSEPVPIERCALDHCRTARAHGMKWVAVSSENVKHIATTFQMAEEEIVVIPNRPCGGGRAYTRDGNVRAEVRAEFGFPSNATIALTVARLTEQKGHIDIISIAPQLIRRYANLYFLWAGSGELQEALGNSLYSEGLADRICLAGYRNDVGRLLDACDLFVLPSLWEGSPFALGEAITARCPIVASTAGGNPELISHGMGGRLFEPSDRVALYNSVCWALDNYTEMLVMIDAAANDFAKSRNTMTNTTMSLLNQSMQDVS